MDRIEVTPLAIENIRELRKEYGEDDWGLRFGLSGGGCSGYKYVLEFEDESLDGDQIFEFGDVKVFVNTEHMDSGFSIDNPQAKRPCGCGASVDF